MPRPVTGGAGRGVRTGRLLNDGIESRQESEIKPRSALFLNALPAIAGNNTASLVAGMLRKLETKYRLGGTTCQK